MPFMRWRTDDAGRRSVDLRTPGGRPMTADEVREVFRRHADQLVGLENRAAKELLLVYREAGRDLVGRLAMTAPERFDAQHMRVALGQIQTGAVEMARRLGIAMDAATARAVEAAQVELAEKVAALSSHFEGSVRTFSVRPIEEALRAEIPGVGSVGGLLSATQEQAAGSIADATVSRLRSQLAVSLVAREPFFGRNSLVERVKRVLNTGDYPAERTARTEHSRAFNAAHHQELVDANAAGDDYQKSVIVIHDRRTAADSIGLEAWLADRGGGIGLDEPFRDGAGRLYLHPPGRPNDREVEIPWRREWGGGAGYRSLRASGVRALKG